MKPTILIVDDIAALRISIRSMLEEEFSVVGEATDGREALQLIEALKPNLVLMDVVMPNMSGIEATREMISRFSEPPKVVMLSGLRDQIVVAQALSAGARDYLFKPVDEARLIQVLKAVLDEPKV